jgi:Ser/Thr protein kinase RdoA (MazF antagonist)
MTSDSAVFNVLSNYTALPRDVQAKRMGGGGGFSGSQIWQVTAAGRVYCLRQWPQEHPDRGRLTFIHYVLRLAADKGLPFVPAPLQSATGATFIENQGRFWELTPWLPGTADFWARPTPERLRAALEALARFHQAPANCVAPPLGSGFAPAFVERRERLAGLLEGGLGQLQAAVSRVPLRPQLDSLLGESLANLRPVGLRLLPSLTDAAKRPLPLQPAIRDIWHDHVLFEGERVTGIVDYGALRIDTPLTDIARLVGSLVEDDARLRKVALDAYSAVRPLPAADRELVDLLDYTSVLISLANWAHWLYVDRREFDDLSAIEARVSKLAGRLQRLR